MVCLTRSSPTNLPITTTTGLLSDANVSLIEELPIAELVVCTFICMGGFQRPKLKISGHKQYSTKQTPKPVQQACHH